jgi:hypothetical protein
MRFAFPPYAKAMMIRRFCRPLFSILAIVTGPISAVLRICVPHL